MWEVLPDLSLAGCWVASPWEVWAFGLELLGWALSARMCSLGCKEWAVVLRYLHGCVLICTHWVSKHLHCITDDCMPPSFCPRPALRNSAYSLHAHLQSQSEWHCIHCASSFYRPKIRPDIVQCGGSHVHWGSTAHRHALKPWCVYHATTKRVPILVRNFEETAQSKRQLSPSASSHMASADSATPNS